MKTLLVTERRHEFEFFEEGLQNTNDVNLAALIGARKHVFAGDTDLSKFDGYDMYIVKMSKIKEGYEKSWLDIVNILRARYPTKLIGIYQEAELDWAIMRPIDEQYGLYSAIMNADFFMAHNDIDSAYYGLMSSKVKCFSVRTPIPIEKIYSFRKNFQERKERFEIVFGSSFDNRSYGLLGLLVAGNVKKVHEGARLTQYCRSEYADDRNNTIKSLFGYDFEVMPRLDWFSFCSRLSQSYVSMNLMLAAAAGRDAIMFAALGIPHIGNMRLDAMRICFPDLCIDPLDTRNAKILLLKLIEDESFYKKVSEEAMRTANDYFYRHAIKADLKMKFKEHLGIDI